MGKVSILPHACQRLIRCCPQNVWSSRSTLRSLPHAPCSGGGRLRVAFLRGGPRSRYRLAPSWISLRSQPRRSALQCCVRMLPLHTSLNSWLRCSIVQCYYTLNKWPDSGALRRFVWEETPQVEKCLLYTRFYYREYVLYIRLPLFVQKSVLL